MQLPVDSQQTLLSLTDWFKSTCVGAISNCGFTVESGETEQVSYGASWCVQLLVLVIVLDRFDQVVLFFDLTIMKGQSSWVR